MRFRKKPVVIDAVQFDAQALRGEWPKGICTAAHNLSPHVHTLEGMLRVSHGDWIITGVVGEIYPCKPDVFEKTYEPVVAATVPA